MTVAGNEFMLGTRANLYARRVLAALRKRVLNNERVFSVAYEESFVGAAAYFITLHVRHDRSGNPLDIILKPWAPTNVDNLPSWITTVAALPFKQRSVTMRTNHDSYPTRSQDRQEPERI